MSMRLLHAKSHALAHGAELENLKILMLAMYLDEQQLLIPYCSHIFAIQKSRLTMIDVCLLFVHKTFLR